MLGFHDAGKTTILYKLLYQNALARSNGELNVEDLSRSVIPTLFLNAEALQYDDDTTVCVFDIAGLLPLWAHFCHNERDGLIFVIDASNHSDNDACTRTNVKYEGRGVMHAKTVLHKYVVRMQEEPTGQQQQRQWWRKSRQRRTRPLLVYANFQDVKGSMDATQLEELLDLESVLPDRNMWHIQPCSAVDGTGLWEGMDWLVNRMR